MQIHVVKSKIHRVKVTGADLNHIGSITIDNNNGERLETYVIPGPRNTGEITLNGAAARKVAKGDILIIISYGIMDMEEARNFKPSLVFPDEETNLLK